MRRYLLGTLVSLSVGLGYSAAAAASTFHRGWSYSLDALGDGAGGDIYDIQAIAVKLTTQKVFVSIQANFPLEGATAAAAEDGNIGWGDLFFNVSGLPFEAASQAQTLTAIRFSATNDSGAPQVGVYQNVTAKSVTSTNSGFANLKAYYDAGWLRSPTLGDLATPDATYAYFGEESPVLNVIGSGEYSGTITFLDQLAADNAGLDFEHFGLGSPAPLTFSFDRALMSSESLIASLFVECANDGIALVKVANPGVRETVPEPSAIPGLALVWLVWRGCQKLRSA